jgi:hypothetical protein
MNYFFESIGMRAWLEANTMKERDKIRIAHGWRNGVKWIGTAGAVKYAHRGKRGPVQFL